MLISNRALQGLPTLPFEDNVSWAGNDQFIDMEFLDHTQTPVVPTTLTLEIDDLTNSIDMLGPITLTAGGSTSPPLIYAAFAASMTIQVAGSIMVMTFPYEGSQICQFSWTFTAIDSVTGQSFTGKKVDIVTLAAIATVTGN